MTPAYGASLKTRTPRSVGALFQLRRKVPRSNISASAVRFCISATIARPLEIKPLRIAAGAPFPSFSMRGASPFSGILTEGMAYGGSMSPLY